RPEPPVLPVSCQADSGAYERSEEPSEAFVALQYPLLTSRSWVPPTQTSYGVEQRPFTARPEPVLALPTSQPEAPLSPEETKDVIPCAAACAHREPKKEFSEAPSEASQSPKLVDITSARLLSTMYFAETSTPSVETVAR